MWKRRLYRVDKGEEVQRKEGHRMRQEEKGRK